MLFEASVKSGAKLLSIYPDIMGKLGIKIIYVFDDNTVSFVANGNYYTAVSMCDVVRVALGL